MRTPSYITNKLGHKANMEKVLAYLTELPDKYIYPPHRFITKRRVQTGWMYEEPNAYYVDIACHLAALFDVKPLKSYSLFDGETVVYDSTTWAENMEHILGITARDLVEAGAYDPPFGYMDWHKRPLDVFQALYDKHFSLL